MLVFFITGIYILFTLVFYTLGDIFAMVLKCYQAVVPLRYLATLSNLSVQRSCLFMLQNRGSRKSLQEN